MPDPSADEPKTKAGASELNFPQPSLTSTEHGL
jgi:hypothetical protein